MIPYNTDSRESYINRQAVNHLVVAKMHHELGNKHAMWLQLFNWAMSEDFYGQHWDKLRSKE